MRNGKIIAVIIPCYNVEQTVADVVRRIPEEVDHLIAVDDASVDGTRRILTGIPDNRLVVLTHDQNQGVGGAMATGFERAMGLNADIAVKIDGDGQMDPSLIPELINPLLDGSCDYVKGNRFLHTRELRQMPLSRKIGNILLTFFTKFASGYWHVFDPQNGFLAIHRDFMAALDLGRLRNARYFCENELLIQLNVMVARVQDYPMPAHYNDAPSSLRVRRVILPFAFRLIRGFLFRSYHRYVLRDFSVIVPLYLLGAPLFLFGIIFGSYKWWYYATQAQQPAPTGTIMLAVLPLILGFQMVIQALLIDILQSPKPDRRR